MEEKVVENNNLGFTIEQLKEGLILFAEIYGQAGISLKDLNYDPDVTEY